jgi:hypothetical protein
MQFRVSAIQDQGTPASMNDARCALEDKLNAQLRDTDFGCKSLSVLIVVFSTNSLPKAPAPSRLTKLENGTPLLALHVVIDPEVVQQTPAPHQLRLLCNEVSTKLPTRPVRRPKDLEYERMHQAVIECALDVARSAA